MSDTPQRPGPGRPRDTSITDRVLEEAITLFGERGWSGFTIDQVATLSGVGKAAIYRRWSSKEDLLIAALTACIPTVEDVDTGSLAGDLRSFAHQIIGLYTGRYGQATRRLIVEADFTPALRERLEEFNTSQIRAARDLVSRAAERGYVDQTLPTTLILNVINGAAMSYAMSTPARRATHQHAGAFADQLVDFVLVGLDALAAQAR